MIERVEAIYCGGGVRPIRELPLRDQQRVRLTVETINEIESDREAAIVQLRADASAPITSTTSAIIRSSPAPASVSTLGWSVSDETDSSGAAA